MLINKKEIMFSVIIPNFNREKSIVNAIRSVLAQNYSKFELIIVDDCSTDNSIENISSFSDSRIRVLNFKENSGVAAARNFGIKNSKGDFISLLDSDDYYDPFFLEESLKTLESAPEGAGFMWTGVRYIEQGEKSEFFWKPAKRDSAYLTFLHSLHIGTNSGITIKKEVFQTCGYFNESLPAAEDTDFFLRITQKFDFTSNSKILINIERDKNDRLSKNFEKIGLAYNSFITPHLEVINQDKSLQLKFYYKLMWLNFNLKEKEKARYFYKKIPRVWNLGKFRSLITRLIYEIFPLNTARKLHRRFSSR